VYSRCITVAEHLHSERIVDQVCRQGGKREQVNEYSLVSAGFFSEAQRPHVTSSIQQSPQLMAGTSHPGCALDIHRLETGQTVREDRTSDLRQSLLHMGETLCDGVVVFQIVKRSQQARMRCAVPERNQTERAALGHKGGSIRILPIGYDETIQCRPKIHKAGN
jgi:hypothetical protein